MGIYDRSYYRGDERSSWLAGRPMVINLILLNVAIYLCDFLFDQQLTEYFALRSNLLTHPWQAYQLLTYGFLHSQQIAHILFNMLFLWVFGTEIENLYGRAEFLRFYLVTIVLAGLVWVGIETASGQNARLIGASGGVMGVMILYVFNFPKRLLYIWGVLPVPAWVLGALYVMMDLMGVAHPHGSDVANVAHLAGAAFGAIYFQTRLNLGRLIPRRLSDLSGNLLRKPKLRIHDPEQETRDLNQQVDAILEKISREGEASLTRKERRTLEEASRRYQQRRQ